MSTINAIQDLPITLDAENDLLVVGGIKYAAELFRGLGVGGLQAGQVLQIVSREDGTLTLKQLDAATEPSPTAGMTIEQRILHVGGRNNAAGYVEFGSTQSVLALVRQVLRDLPAAAELLKPAGELTEQQWETLRRLLLEFGTAMQEVVLHQSASKADIAQASALSRMQDIRRAVDGLAAGGGV